MQEVINNKTDENAEDNNKYRYINNEPGLDKQGAMYRAQQEGENISPCGFCNRGDCIECAFAYNRAKV